MKCPYCGKVYKSKRFYKLHIAKHEESEVKYREVVYLGTADKATVKGVVTGKKYTFLKDKYNMPVSTKVDEKDYPGIVVLKGKGCARRDPTALYMSKNDWNLEIAVARVVNS